MFFLSYIVLFICFHITIVLAVFHIICQLDYCFFKCVAAAIKFYIMTKTDTVCVFILIYFSVFKPYLRFGIEMLFAFGNLYFIAFRIYLDNRNIKAAIQKTVIMKVFLLAVDTVCRVRAYILPGIIKIREIFFHFFSLDV